MRDLDCDLCHGTGFTTGICPACDGTGDAGGTPSADDPDREPADPLTW